MIRIPHSNPALSILLVIFSTFVSCTGSTTIQTVHPRIAEDSNPDKTLVYFIRPNSGFQGVMDRPVTISLDGAELLRLAKGQYTLMSLLPGTGNLQLDGFTVSGPANTMVRVSTDTTMQFNDQATVYLLIETSFRGGSSGSEFRPRQVSRENALQATLGLEAVGLAGSEPLR